jgi:hypothetical protein
MNTELQLRIEALSEEIRSYPRPIARCDEQLSGLIEQRALLLKELSDSNEHGRCSPTATWTNDGGFNAA